jgi:hypothetical protein
VGVRSAPSHQIGADNILDLRSEVMNLITLVYSYKFSALLGDDRSSLFLKQQKKKGAKSTKI